MGRKRTSSDDITLTWDGTFHGLAWIFERIADHYGQRADQNWVAGLREAANLTRKLAAGRGAA